MPGGWSAGLGIDLIDKTHLEVSDLSEQRLVLILRGDTPKRGVAPNGRWM